jgi:hypothetical protein
MRRVSDDQPVAFRARARMEPSRWLRRPKHMMSFDARWAGGREEYDVDLVALMYRRAPADYAVTRDAMLANCPAVGTGRWVWYPWGSVVESDPT